MASIVVRQVAMGRECAPTPFEAASDRLLAVVDPLVGLQVALLSEPFVATLEVADERLFTDMGALVDF